jgi:two-component system chemotaxis sensor kinase CheA
VVIEMQDDGRGIQWERLRQSAVEKGLISPERAATLSATEAFELLFVSGLSTSARVTALSGRGVGMDVVRDNVRQLGGQVEVASQADQFTRVRLVLPLTLSLTHALICRVGTRLYAIPMANVAGSVTVPQEAVRTLRGEETLLLEDATIPLLRLNRVLGLPDPEQRRTTYTCVLLRRLEGPLAYAVDALEDEREIVLKPLGRALAKNPLFSAGTLLSGGRIVLVLNAATLAHPQALREIAPLSATRPAFGRAAAPAAPPRARRILVVDDSITTRELERSILQSAGYETEVAVDGLDALERLAHGRYDLIVTDIEMPRMDGFTLTQRVRADARLRELPVVAVTARENDEDRRRGLECGASAYIAKSTFAQDNLLQTVRSLLG